MTEFVIADCLTMRRLRLLCAVGTTLGQVTRDLYTVTVNITPVTPKEIKLSCSCPDWAEMCKHVAAVLYGVGARFDEKPALLFELRRVDENELLANAGENVSLKRPAPATTKLLDDGGDVAALFGLEMVEPARPATPTSPGRSQQRKTPRGQKTRGGKSPVTQTKGDRKRRSQARGP